MNIQIFGNNKCFDTKKAERYFKERGIRFQFIDLPKFGMSNGEFNSIYKFIGDIECIIDYSSKTPDASLIRYLCQEDKIQKLLGNPKLFKTPIVRNGKVCTVGYCPYTWKEWQ